MLERHKAMIFASAVPCGRPSRQQTHRRRRTFCATIIICCWSGVFYFLERERQMGLLVMDEVEKTEDRRFVQRLQTIS